jgi:hypothetical protein
MRRGRTKTSNGAVNVRRLALRCPGRLDVVGPLARCLLVSKEASTLVDLDLATGQEVRRVEPFPRWGDMCWTSEGSGLGLRRTAAVGQGPTELWFLDPTGRVMRHASLPDAPSQVARGPEGWHIGCRNGRLYAFEWDGTPRWSWEMPGARAYDGNVYVRPCPITSRAVPASRPSRALGTSMRLDRAGRRFGTLNSRTQARRVGPSRGVGHRRRTFERHIAFSASRRTPPGPL